MTLSKLYIYYGLKNTIYHTEYVSISMILCAYKISDAQLQ